ncbi:bifunctional serine/threonine-protein kinase/formylglycine-generating enzyme family protein [Tuwongella immobilis]|uniref:Protein kinase domain-containing protein n=1 Tax=Tuwongella immobilis TaxID=692036 RepID=A0A6C2YGQ8_9BACT|nr:bifunctional serine/threonine-protein kinase/formylglycine-generating enzyme family protein [Tuwongella immobilis]VIP00676.1 serine threonine protein kinase : Serine/threonine protein kinase OS=Isosphaera pallida (strain ATCC 43644 / DSM 9630 / IS1B) GN=Isop_2159 PE=3 SV=1: Pkinase: FGE-sulfatase [Tuwongella immobilis]VTR96770.1 serine threonine protein kinase : Serine/threonine protein kinase OS=Isosphaera pallida (strain ATCC 43644 / DSM 9630 / IS1B) GN=Isop_2159 PE=3 SV=1: Pkinase: FGE-sulf
MALSSLPMLVEVLERYELLPPEQLRELRILAVAPTATFESICEDLKQREWLTPFQLDAILAERGKYLVLDQYVLLDRLGAGGMGEVFKARHRRLGRIVAVKVIRKERLDNPETIRRFKFEVQAAAKLQHPNIVMAFDAHQEGELHFLSMEYIDGLTLTRLVKSRERLPLHEACDYIRQAALGLQHAHEQELVHRDIKPGNLIITKLGRTLKILDFGLARVNTVPTGSVETRVTQEGFLVGTPDYLSPEQAIDARNVDIRADIYSLGCTLYFALTGQPLYPGGTPTEKLVHHATVPAPDIRVLRPDVSPGFARLLAKLLAKRPADRFQTPLEVAQALEPYCLEGGPIEPLGQLLPPPGEGSTETRFRLDDDPSEPSASSSRTSRTSKPSNPLPIALGAAATCLALVLGGVLYLSSGPKPLDVPSRFENDATMTMVLIRPGSFRMGSPDDEANRDPCEGPTHEVTLTNAYYISINEITQGQYRVVTGESPSLTKPVRGAADWPVEHVSYENAVEFCRKLTEFDKQKPEGWRYRLPTEAEWEYAARAGTQTRFCSGDWVRGHYDGKQPLAGVEPIPFTPKGPSQVGRYSPNLWGLHDVHGNVAEWCLDWFSEKGYPDSAPVSDPVGPESGKLRIVRGGSWQTGGAQCRSAARAGRPPEYQGADVGFRVVLVPPQ